MYSILLWMVFFQFSYAQDATVRDVGVVGLFSHDVFSWNYRTKKNEENGVLDLSTIFDYGNGRRWQKGGNPKNSENAPVFSIVMNLVDYYKKQKGFYYKKLLRRYKKDIAEKQASISARKDTVLKFREMVLETYERITGDLLPMRGLKDGVNNTEQASLRAMHDILPGHIKLYRGQKGETLRLTNLRRSKTQLNQSELDQSIPPFDGDYDPEFLDIDVGFHRINLKKIDGRFIKSYSPYNQVKMLQELKLYGAGSLEFQDVSFSDHVVEMIQKSICPPKSKWLPNDISCK